MSDYSVTLVGDEELLRRLDKAGGQEVMVDGLTAIGIDYSTKMKVYPPVPPGSTYERTMQLRNKWTFEVASDGSELVAGNATPYAPYVQDRELQNKSHQRNGWSTAQGMLQLHLDRYKKIFFDFIKGALHGK